jgi:hypothetical protein
MLQGKWVDRALYPKIMAIIGNPRLTMETDIIIFALAFFKPFWHGSTSRNKL